MPPEQKRPLLHKMIDELPAKDFDLVEQVLARLEMERLWGELREGFEADWSAGKYEKLDEVIREVRGGGESNAA